MEKRVGNLLSEFEVGDLNVIIHGCNCMCNMGAGIAKDIAQRYPEAEKADKATRVGDTRKLGSFTSVNVKFGMVVNAYTQYDYKGAGMKCDYRAIRNVFAGLKRLLGGKGLVFGVPAIGCGRAGGDWNKVSAIIEEEMAGERVVFVEYPSGKDSKWDYRKNLKG